jgi:hypothetical protein
MIAIFDSKDIGLMYLPTVNRLMPHVRRGAVTIGCIVCKGVAIRGSWMFDKIIRHIRCKILIKLCNLISVGK